MTKCKTIMLLITYRCNLHCLYCYEPKTLQKKMSLESAKSYVQNIVDSLDDSFTEFEIQYMGGEPLLEFQLIKELSEWLWQYNFKIPLVRIFAVTNGTLLDDNMKHWFHINKDKIRLGLSFDGDILMQNINRSKSSSDVDLNFFAENWPNQTVKMTISPETIGRILDGAKFLISAKLPHITADLAMGNLICWRESHLGILWSQLHEIGNFYLEHPELPIFSMLGIDIFTPFRKSSIENGHCSCGENLVCVDTDGEQYACHLFAPITLPENMAKESQRINFKSKQNYYAPECSNCSLKNLCPHCFGMNYKSTGDFQRQSTFTCQSTKIIYLAACQFQKERAKKRGDKELTNQIETILNHFQLL